MTSSLAKMVAALDLVLNRRMDTKASDTDHTKFIGYTCAAANENGVASNAELYADISCFRIT